VASGAIEEDNDPIVPTLKSRQSMASRLCAFLRFCEQSPSRDWRGMTYQEDLLAEYQPGLLRGTCSATRRPLGAATVNAYLDEAVLFLSWAAERGHCPPLKVPHRRLRLSFGGKNHPSSHKGKIVQQRYGKLQVVGDPLSDLPSAAEVYRWLASVRLRAPVKAIQFELILRTGMRLSEVNEMRMTCFPDKEFQGGERWNPRWKERGYVPVKLRYGVKGGKVEPASKLSTRSRLIEVPIDLAERVWHYKKVVRPTLLRRFMREHRSKDLSEGRLWLGEDKRQPVSNAMLYKVWTQTPHCPPGWNPHDGRHFFAVEKVCEHARLMMVQHGKDDPRAVNVGWLHGLLAGQVRLILSPLLGHANEDTTMRYLSCAHRRLVSAFGHPAFDWNAFLDEE